MVYPTPVQVGAHATKALWFPADNRGTLEITDDGHFFFWLKPGLPGFKDEGFGTMPAGHAYWGAQHVLDVKDIPGGVSVVGPNGHYEYHLAALPAGQV